MSTKKNQKPIDIEGHFKYRCPNIDCGYVHWLSFKEVKTRNFKVVCDCGTVFKPKQIKTIKIVYTHTESATKDKIDTKPQEIIPNDMLNICSKILKQYGFTDEESETLLSKTYQLYKPDTSELLVKYALQNLGAINDPT